jgi:hypothetical protein
MRQEHGLSDISEDVVDPVGGEGMARVAGDVRERGQEMRCIASKVHTFNGDIIAVGAPGQPGLPVAMPCFSACACYSSSSHDDLIRKTHIQCVFVRIQSLQRQSNRSENAHAMHRGRTRDAFLLGPSHSDLRMFVREDVQTGSW